MFINSRNNNSISFQARIKISQQKSLKKFYDEILTKTNSPQIKRMEELASTASTVSTGSLSITTGFGGYSASAGAMMHRTILSDAGNADNLHAISNNNSIASCTDFLLDKTANLVNAVKIEDGRYFEQDKDGLSQSIISSLTSAFGGMLQTLGAYIIKKAQKTSQKIINKTTKNIPS